MTTESMLDVNLSAEFKKLRRLACPHQIALRVSVNMSYLLLIFVMHVRLAAALLKRQPYPYTDKIFQRAI